MAFENRPMSYRPRSQAERDFILSCGGISKLIRACIDVNLNHTLPGLISEEITAQYREVTRRLIENTATKAKEAEIIRKTKEDRLKMLREGTDLFYKNNRDWILDRFEKVAIRGGRWVKAIRFEIGHSCGVMPTVPWLTDYMEQKYLEERETLASRYNYREDVKQYHEICKNVVPVLNSEQFPDFIAAHIDDCIGGFEGSVVLEEACAVYQYATGIKVRPGAMIAALERFFTQDYRLSLAGMQRMAGRAAAHMSAAIDQTLTLVAGGTGSGYPSSG